MSHLMFVFCVILTAFFLAKVEINMEGKYGYAAKLPVEWRIENQWLRSLIGGTSYHFYMGLFLFVYIHGGLIIQGTWTLQKDFLILSYLAFITVAEDFLWFVLNPYFGIRKFKRECIPWFEHRWLWFCPAWYWWYLPICTILYWLGGKSAF